MRFTVDIRREVVQFERARFVVEAPDLRQARQRAADGLTSDDVMDTVQWETIDMDFRPTRIDAVRAGGAGPASPGETTWVT